MLNFYKVSEVGIFPRCTACFPASPNKAKHDFMFIRWLGAIRKHEWVSWVLIPWCSQGLGRCVRLFAPIVKDQAFLPHVLSLLIDSTSLISEALLSLFPIIVNLSVNYMSTLCRTFEYHLWARGSPMSEIQDRTHCAIYKPCCLISYSILKQIFLWLSFLTYKMGLIIISSSQSYCN